MADNERVEIVCNDIYYGQLASSQASRTQYYPGNPNITDAAVFRDYRVPTGNPALDTSGPRKIERVRVVKLGRNTICDDTLPAPVITRHVVEPVSGVSISGTHEIDETTTPSNPAILERPSGYDAPAEA